MLVLCTGAAPRRVPLPLPENTLHPTPLDLDTTLSPTLLAKALPRGTPTTVGVVGSSHSAVLVIMNLFNLAKTTHPHLRIRWFARSPTLRYAQYMDGWILYDNTGLKGNAATFAKENIDGDALATSPVGKFCERIDCSGGPEREAATMQRELPGCKFVVQAVGYELNALPALRSRAKGPIEGLAYQHESGAFRDAAGHEVKGLFGAGIAFPERVVDKAGNTEYAVGFWKFMNYLKRVTPQWVEGMRN
jgi:hypothetical protein